MGNREHNKLLQKCPYIGIRRYSFDGPPKWLKKVWNSKFRKDSKNRLRKDGGDAVYKKRPGNIYDWY